MAAGDVTVEGTSLNAKQGPSFDGTDDTIVATIPRQIDCQGSCSFWSIF